MLKDCSLPSIPVEKHHYIILSLLVTVKDGEHLSLAFIRGSILWNNHFECCELDIKKDSQFIKVYVRNWHESLDIFPYIITSHELNLLKQGCYPCSSWIDVKALFPSNVIDPQKTEFRCLFIWDICWYDNTCNLLRWLREMSCWFLYQFVGQPVKNMRIMRNWSNKWMGR